MRWGIGSISDLLPRSPKYRPVFRWPSMGPSTGCRAEPQPLEASRAGKSSVSRASWGGFCRSSRAIPCLACQGRRRWCGAGGRIDQNQRACGGARQGGNRAGSAQAFVLSMWVRIFLITAGSSMQAMLSGGHAESRLLQPVTGLRQDRPLMGPAATGSYQLKPGARAI
jgi:hypothetical protein